MSAEPSLIEALSAIVGEGNATIDRGSMATYAWNGGVGAMPGPKFIPVWPEAVVWPTTTEQVAAVVRLCGARGLKFSAHSTGVGACYLSREAKTVMMDLGQMNHLEIDADRQTAVIQPGVTAGRLMAEAMKVGLTNHVVGAGPPHSPLASATSFMGIGVTGSSTGMNARNILSLEWVTPSGEIVRIGTNGDDWFSEEGPGPGFRGMLRGLLGAQSGIGVFTRIGYKLHPWAGPARLRTTGRHPQIGMELDPNMRFFWPVWDNAEAMRDATFRLNETGVIFAMLRMPPNHVGWSLSMSNYDYVRSYEAGDLPDIARVENRFCWQIMTIGHSLRQATYQEQVVRKIVAETGGRLLDVAQEHAEVMAYNLVTSVYVGRVFRGAASGGTSFGVVESFGLLPRVFAEGEALMEKERQPGGAFVADGKEGFWAWPSENRSFWTECILASEANSRRGTAAMLNAFLQHFVTIKNKPGFGMMGFLSGAMMVDVFGPNYSRVNDWMRRIKNLFDPADTAVSGNYITPRKGSFGPVWRMTERFLFSSLGRPVLHFFTGQMGKAGELDFDDKRD